MRQTNITLEKGLKKIGTLLYFTLHSIAQILVIDAFCKGNNNNKEVLEEKKRVIWILTFQDLFTVVPKKLLWISGICKASFILVLTELAPVLYNVYS